MDSSSYRLPKWINGLWAVSMMIIAVLYIALGHEGRDVWGTISVAMFALLLGFTATYNKIKTGRCLPNKSGGA